MQKNRGGKVFKFPHCGQWISRFPHCALCTVWIMRRYSLTRHFWQKFRESNVLTKEITEELIWRNLFLVRRKFSFFHTVVWCGNNGNLLSSHIFGKNFVKITFLLKKLLESWFDEFFLSDSKIFIFPHCDTQIFGYFLKSLQSFFTWKWFQQKKSSKRDFFFVRLLFPIDNSGLSFFYVKMTSPEKLKM